MSLKEEVEMLKLRVNTLPKDTEHNHSTIPPIEPLHVGDIWILDKRHQKQKIS
jgi:hypothetical protein